MISCIALLLAIQVSRTDCYYILLTSSEAKFGNQNL